MPFDLYDEEHAPEAHFNALKFFIHIPYKHREALRADGVTVNPFVYVEVDNYGWVSVESYHWFDHQSREGKKWEAQKEILWYLQEWEYVELRDIGPEDAEWFATDKLLSLQKVVTDEQRRY